MSGDGRSQDVVGDMLFRIFASESAALSADQLEAVIALAGRRAGEAIDESTFSHSNTAGAAAAGRAVGVGRIDSRDSRLPLQRNTAFPAPELPPLQNLSLVAAAAGKNGGGGERSYGPSGTDQQQDARISSSSSSSSSSRSGKRRPVSAAGSVSSTTSSVRRKQRSRQPLVPPRGSGQYHPAVDLVARLRKFKLERWARQVARVDLEVVQAPKPGGAGAAARGSGQMGRRRGGGGAGGNSSSGRKSSKKGLPPVVGSSKSLRQKKKGLQRTYLRKTAPQVRAQRNRSLGQGRGASSTQRRPRQRQRRKPKSSGTASLVEQFAATATIAGRKKAAVPLPSVVTLSPIRPANQEDSAAGGGDAEELSTQAIRELQAAPAPPLGVGQPGSNVELPAQGPPDVRTWVRSLREREELWKLEEKAMLEGHPDEASAASALARCVGVMPGIDVDPRMKRAAMEAIVNATGDPALSEELTQLAAGGNATKKATSKKQAQARSVPQFTIKSRSHFVFRPPDASKIPPKKTHSVGAIGRFEKNIPRLVWKSPVSSLGSKSRRILAKNLRMEELARQRQIRAVLRSRKTGLGNSLQSNPYSLYTEVIIAKNQSRAD